jgi:hypothetical protein
VKPTTFNLMYDMVASRPLAKLNVLLIMAVNF